MKNLEFVENYKNNDDLRQSFCRLSKEIFGIDFWDFYSRGLWNDRYICHSYADKSEIIANVSVSLINIVLYSKKIKAVQIGSVMTHPDYRKKGIAADLMRHVIKKYENECELIYLFANKNVLDFYPKFGFSRAAESKYSLKIAAGQEQVNSDAKRLDVAIADDFSFLKEFSMKRCLLSGIFDVADSWHILMFHCLYIYKDCLYYFKDINAIILFKSIDGIIHLYDVICHEKISFDNIIKRIAVNNETEVLFYFTPDVEGIKFDITPYCDPDDVFFVYSTKIVLPDFLSHPITAHA